MLNGPQYGTVGVFHRGRQAVVAHGIASLSVVGTHVSMFPPASAGPAANPHPAPATGALGEPCQEIRRLDASSRPSTGPARLAVACSSRRKLIMHRKPYLI